MSVLRSLTNRMPSSVRQRIAALRDRLLLSYESLVDRQRHARYMTPADAAFTPNLSDRHLETQLTKDYHRIEKGLAMPAPKRPFGSAVESRLTALLPVADRSNDPLVQKAAARAREALSALEAWNIAGSADTDIAPIADQSRPMPAKNELEDWFNSRHSMRDFDPSHAVDNHLLATAASWSRKTPSVCNRQAGRVHVFQDRETIAELLKVQAGNAGFGQTVPTLVVFTAESTLFAGTGERNQRWIDGALFAMTYTWALHGLGVHSCMLNWSKRNAHSKVARRIGDIPDSEDIICFLAIGYPRNGQSRVARSPRRDIDDVLSIH